MELKNLFTRFWRFSTMTVLSGFPRKSTGNKHFQRKSCAAVGCFLFFILMLSLAYRTFRSGETDNDTVYLPLTLDDPNTFPAKIVRADSSLASTTNLSCTFFGCFDVYRCGTRGNKLLVYVYPPKSYVDPFGTPIAGQMSREFYEILRTIVSSKFYTPDPHEACIFIPSIDTLNQNRLKLRRVSQALRSLEL